MEEDKEDIRDVILEELKRLGITELERKKSHHVSHGSKLLGINTSSNIKSNNFRAKNKTKRSPRTPRSRSPLLKTNNANRARDERKHKTPKKSPFATSKRKAEQRKQNAKDKTGKVFGQRLEDIASVCVYMADGTQVTAPEFLVDVCNLIRRNITVEGIFRKAGSSQRQSDLKKLIDSNNSLPTNVHVIDGACLLKQFLRCLPEPLLTSDVHSKIIKCMDLSVEFRIEAVTLCTLLLPERHRHTLIYLMDFLTEVVASSGSNLMDAHNLAIVLAPNLLPTTITPTTRRKNFQNMPSEDVLLTTNIEILQLIIENGSRFCQMPSGLALALEHREQSKSTENLLASQLHSAVRKKRRSASIHRLMTGLRRVVGHSSVSGSPLKASESVEYLDSLHQHPGVALSPAPTYSISPRKRKSADAFELCTETPRDAGGDAHHVTTPPSSKRVRVESEVGVGACTSPATATSTCTNLDVTPPAVSNILPTTIVTSATPCERQRNKIVKPVTIREIEDTWEILTQSPYRATPKSSFKESFSSKIRTLSKSPGFNVHTIHSSMNRQSFDRVEPLGQPKEDKGYPRAYSDLSVELMPLKKTRALKRRSCDVPLGGVKRAGNFEEPERIVRRSSLDWRSTGNEPDGADVSTLGPRGIPDGAECNLRDGMMPKPTVSSSLEELEQHYDDIKAVVKTMEAEMDKTNVQQMKETYFPNSSLTSENMSYSEMIQSAYERMKVESKDLGSSPSQNLSKRLDKELKIRNRRSGEHRVMRSPSERKIGTIRRRSRELVQNAAKSMINIEDTPKAQAHQTPKMKEPLMQTPVNGSLRRGKPNSVKSGLPFVVRSFSPLQKEEALANCSNRTVIVSKRVDMASSAKSPHQQPCSHESSKNSIELDLKGSLGDIPSLSLDENLMDSIVELLPGPLTRRRSSLLSSLVSSFPILKIPSSENFSGLGTEDIDSSISSSKEHMDLSETENQESLIKDQGNQSSVMALPAVILAGKDVEEEQWVPAAEFSYGDKEEQQGAFAIEGNHGRPSLAALMKQKKVTANVQLFNNLHTVSPIRQSNSRLRSTTPQQNIPPRSTASERRNVRLSYSKSMNNRSTLTPRELIKARQRSFQFDRSPINLAKVAVVSPLKESTWINVQQEHAHEVPKAFKGEATIPPAPTCNEKSFKPPVAPVTPIRPFNQFKAIGKNTETPPKLPPRSGVRPSPIRIQYR
ncbi:uncharacterized protein [Macrobrachium rosenbergii]|uniref:uncharacterized protein isoform X1 n=1 Tax=Macrobrachium rosenbergii TaxID=79674 RepID=UPI0034D647FA